MKPAKIWTVCTALTVFTLTVLSASVSMADNQQKNKNLWRNLGIGAGVIAGHGLINGNGTEALIGAAGAAYSANRYEQDRKSQSENSQYRARYHRRYRQPTGTTFTENNRRYYWYSGHQYYMDLSSGNRYLVP